MTSSRGIWLRPCDTHRLHGAAEVPISSRLAGGADYFTHCNSTGKHDLYHGDKEHREEGYMTDLISQRAIDFVDRMAEGGAKRDAPFFLSLHHTAPHWPWDTRGDSQTPAKTNNNLFHLDGGNVDTYRRMIHHMDEGIGQLAVSLRRYGLLDNTLIVFTSESAAMRGRPAG